MGSSCDPYNLAAIMEAAEVSKGEQPSRLQEELNPEQQGYYESHMAQTQGTPNFFDVAKEQYKRGVGSVLSDMAYRSPSQWMPEELYQPIEQEFQQWYKNGAKPEEYKAISKQANDILKQMDSVIEEHGGQALADILGIKPEQIQYAQQYFDWVAKKGPLDITTNPHTKGMRVLATGIAKAQANMNLMWTFGNVADMIRVYSHYAGKGGFDKVMQGTIAALKQGNPFKRSPELAKMGLYDSVHYENQGANMDPFSWSITAQKNIAHHLDIATGGDGIKGVREVLFDRTPWDLPTFEQTPNRSLLWGLARYPIYEAHWYYDTVRKMLSGDKQAQSEMGLYLLAKTAFLGGASLIPAPIYQYFMTQDDKDQWHELEKNLPVNLIGKATNEAIKTTTGEDFSIDLAGYTQPFGGTIGARLSSLVGSAWKAFQSAGSIPRNIKEGDLDAATINGIASISALMNFTGVTGDLKALNYLNSAQLTKLYGTVAKGLEKDWDSEKWTKNLLKSQFGPAVYDEDKGQPKAASDNLNLDLNLDLDLKL